MRRVLGLFSISIGAGVLLASAASAFDDNQTFSLHLGISAQPTCEVVTCEPSDQFVDEPIYVVVAIGPSESPGFTAVMYGLSESTGNTLVDYVSTQLCPGFEQTGGSFPDSGCVASLQGCRDACTVVAVHEYRLTVGFPLGVTWEIIGSQVGRSIVWDCEGIAHNAVCASHALINGPIGIECACGPTPIWYCFERPSATLGSDWGTIRLLYR
jgi:hypothetical protein